MKLLYQEDETALWWGVGVVRLIVLVIVVLSLCRPYCILGKPRNKKQARKSSEDTHFTEYARFEKVWAG